MLYRESVGGGRLGRVQSEEYYLKVQSYKLRKQMTRIRVSKVSRNFSISTIYDFEVIYPWNLLSS